MAMRPLVVALVLLAGGLAGCSDDGGQNLDTPDDSFDDIQIDVSDTTGAILGIVVDQAIRPLKDAEVKLLLSSGTETTTTDEKGRFSFSNVPAGSHFVEVSRIAYKGAQVAVDVEAGNDSPGLVKVMLERLFSQDPFTQLEKFTGFLVCGYSAGVSSTCANDYTRIVSQCNGGCAPQLAGLAGDKREYVTGVGAGWKTLLFEITWEPSAAGTSDQMGVVVSFTERPGASHWYASEGSGEPLRLQIDAGERHPSNSGEPSMILEEGQDNIFVFMNVATGVSVNQEFEVIQTAFYYAPAPEEWSFIAGDEPPF